MNMEIIDTNAVINNAVTLTHFLLITRPTTSARVKM